MSQQKPTIGRIVIYFPGSQRALPNSMTTAPAIITQTFGEGSSINLSVFVTDGAAPVQSITSVPHKSTVGPGSHYWEWPQKV